MEGLPESIVDGSDDEDGLADSIDVRVFVRLYNKLFVTFAIAHINCTLMRFSLS